MQLVSVPEPVGGALVICANHILYFNQSAKYGITLNEYLLSPYASFSFLNIIMYAQREKTNFPVEESKHVFALDASVCTFISNECLLISLKSGELYPPCLLKTIYFDSRTYLCQLIIDGRNLRSINISKAGASVLPCCVSPLYSSGYPLVEFM